MNDNRLHRRKHMYLLPNSNTKRKIPSAKYLIERFYFKLYKFVRNQMQLHLCSSQTEGEVIDEMYLSRIQAQRFNKLRIFFPPKSHSISCNRNEF